MNPIAEFDVCNNKNQWISTLKEKFNDVNIYINLYINMLIPNVAEKNILTFVLSENQIKIYEDGICGSEPAI